VQRFEIAVPASDPLVSHPTNPDIAISPDGSRVSYVARHADTTRLMLRSMDQAEFKPLAGTEGACCPSFSPDGSSLAFYAGHQLKRVPVNGGAAVIITGAPELNGGLSWTEDDSILFVPGFHSGIWKVQASGGTPQAILMPDGKSHESGYVWPQQLPRRGGILFTSGPDSITSMDDGILAVRPEGNATRVVLKGGTGGRVLPTGHLVYGHSQSLLAVAFDSAKQGVVGNPVPVVEGVAMRQPNGGVRYAVSNTGTLVYVTSYATERPLSVVSVSRQGAVETLAVYPDYSEIGQLAISPAGTQLAFKVSKANDDIHILNLDRRITSRFTFEGGDKVNPVWTPDSARIAYTNTGGNGVSLLSRATDSRGAGEPMLSGDACFPSSFSPDAKMLACTKMYTATGADIWMVRLDGERRAQPFLKTSFNESSPVFSPDGRWVAYVSDESGMEQVYAVRSADGGGKVQLSTDGGTDPVWAASGRELFYRNGDRILSVGIESKATLGVGKAQQLFSMAMVHRESPTYAVTRDGQHFLMVKESETEAARQLNVVVNWFEDLKRRVPLGAK
jgi:serine/threonine-protein kinase